MGEIKSGFGFRFLHRNTTGDLFLYFSTPEKPLTWAEFYEFWDSLNVEQVEYYLTTELA